MGKHLIFLLGGARSGKSQYAEDWARTNGNNVLYVATAEALDDEMRERIAKHQNSRPANWRTLEAPTGVGVAIASAADGVDTIIIDCLTVLTSNILLIGTLGLYSPPCATR